MNLLSNNLISCVAKARCSRLITVFGIVGLRSNGPPLLFGDSNTKITFKYFFGMMNLRDIEPFFRDIGPSG